VKQKINYNKIRDIAERLAKEKQISLNRAMRQVIRYNRWRMKRYD
jgi:hypothetical protein